MKNLYVLISFFSLLLQAQNYTWMPLSSPPATDGRYDDVFFLNENLGWAARGGNGAVYKTTNGGVNWTQQNVSSVTNQYYRNIEFLDENIGFLGTLNSDFYKTTNGGTTWQKVTNISPNPIAICGLDTVGASTVYGCGAWFEPAYIIKSVDKGNTWKYIDMSAYATGLVEIYFLDENVGFVGGKDNNGAIILKTTDGGLTWTKLYGTNIYDEYVWKIQVMSDNTTIFCSIESVDGEMGKLLKSMDGGLTWETKNFPDAYVQAVGFVSKTHGWMGGHNTGFYETKDGGTTWSNMHIGGSLNRIFFVNDNTAFASGNEIYKMTKTLSANDITSDRTERKLKVEVAPNPVSDKFNIKVDYQHSDNLVISLYDASGRFLRVLVKDRVITKGAKTYDINFKEPKGNYVLDVHSNLGRQSIKFIKN